MTVAGEATATIYEKKSEFIAYITHVESVRQAGEYLAVLKKKYYDASHHCYAFSVKGEAVQRQSDDGEPQKTAGMPILDVIKHSGLEDVMIVVIRYFGGTLLGTGGLVRAYGGAAQAALEKAEILVYKTCVDMDMQVEYSLYDKLISCAHTHGAKVISTDFTDTVSIKFRMISGTQGPFLEDIRLITRGRQPRISREFLDIF